MALGAWLRRAAWAGHFPGRSRPGARQLRRGILLGRFRAALERLNPHLPAETLEEVLRKVQQAETPSLVEENRRLHRYLVEGVPVEVAREDGSIGGDTARLIDFDDPDANDWLAVNQFTVIENKNNRRPDVVLFVNGLPLGVIELKNPGDENATLDGAFNQLQTYKDADPVAVPHQRRAGDLGRHAGAHRLADRRSRAVHALAHRGRADDRAEGRAGARHPHRGRVREAPLPRL